MNKRTEEKLKSIEGMKKAMTEILAQAWERGHKMGMLQAQEAQCWIPIKTRELSAEEVKEVNEKYGFDFLDGAEAWCICSPVPEDTQEVLITTKYGDVVLTEFCVDVDGCWFDGWEDRDDVLAWMPLPKPYTKEAET